MGLGLGPTCVSFYDSGPADGQWTPCVCSQLQVAQTRIEYLEKSTVDRAIVSRQEAIICDLENKTEFQKVQIKRFEVLVSVYISLRPREVREAFSVSSVHPSTISVCTPVPFSGYSVLIHLLYKFRLSLLPSSLQPPCSTTYVSIQPIQPHLSLSDRIGQHHPPSMRSFFFLYSFFLLFFFFFL